MGAADYSRKVKRGEMAGLRIFTGNRLEMLADKLAALFATPLASPLTPEVIIVQSRGMERWLSLEIARRRGICANVRFPFPKAFTEEAFAALLGGVPATEAFSPAVLTWKIMGLLPALLHRPAFAPLRHYLEGEGGEAGGVLEGGRPAARGLKRLQLAERTAWLFDQYLIFRPDMVAAWERGETARDDERWQGELWRALVAGETVSHPAARKEAFLREIKLAGEVKGLLPERVSVFGISVLPPFHLEIFQALARRIEVNLFLLNPSREFWGDIRSEREQEREMQRVREIRGDYAASPEGLYLEGGNRLLASLGALGREFFSLILDLGGEEQDFFSEPEEETLLGALQADILNLRNRGEGDRKSIAPEDRSVQFHSCHSPLREVEVLYDLLLSLFEADGELRPHDILVMAPEIEVYAPLIKAVFARPRVTFGEPLPSIPFTIADRDSRLESDLIEGFLKVLDMAGGRFTAGQVLAPLEIPAVAARFGLDPAEVELIRGWVVATGIRWGIDGENRRQLGLPALGDNTWQAGLERLLMGYAMPGKEERLVEGILPYDIEGSETAVLGRFLEYTETLFSRVAALGQSRTLGEWSRTLSGLLEGLFSTPEDGEGGMETLREAVLKLGALQETAGFQEPVTLEVIKACLGKDLSEKNLGFGFLAGGVTFCSLLPMRSIPFKAICLLGMNGADYPRRSWAPAFDLIAKYPRAGDRSRRKDDRYLFLEALLSARKYLLLSYVGQSGADNSLLPPSVLVTELLDYLEEGYGLASGGSLREHLLTTHRLQAFSPAYFQGRGRLFSYSAENWRAARRLLEKKEPRTAPAPLLPPPDETWRQVDLAGLVAFFADPVSFLLRRRLNVQLQDQEDLPEEREPLHLAGLEKYTLEQSLTEWSLAGRDLHDYRAVARAAGRLPHGAVGDYAYGRLRKEVEEFAAVVRPCLAGKEPAVREIELSLGVFRFSGKISLYGGQLIQFRYANLKAKDYLRLWITHLALGMLERGEVAPARLLGKDGAWRFGPPSQPRESLAALLDLYWEGLSRPLKFFPRTSWEYGRLVWGAGKPKEEGLRAAVKTWRGNDFSPGEGEAPGYRICFGAGEPLDEEFAGTAETVLKEIFQLREEMTDGKI